MSDPVDCEPLVDLLPLQAPEAEQLVASVLLQLRVELLPVLMELGFADKVTVGAGVAVTLLTLTAIRFEVVTLPAASRAVAVIE